MIPENIVDSIVQEINQDLQGENRVEFLKSLRDDPGFLRNWVDENVHIWVLNEGAKRRQPIAIDDVQVIGSQMFKAFQEFFRDEISKLPQASAGAPATA